MVGTKGQPGRQVTPVLQGDRQGHPWGQQPQLCPPAFPWCQPHVLSPNELRGLSGHRVKLEPQG